MKILIVVEYAKLGGHVLSSLTIAKELKMKGHEIVYAGGTGDYVEEFRKVFPYHEIEFFPLHAGRQTYFNFYFLKTAKQLIAICENQNIDIIHAFDARSYMVAAMASLYSLHIPYTCTLCGGLTPFYNLPETERLMVFSDEQRDKLVQKYKWPERFVSVIRNRVDMDQFHLVSEEGLPSPLKACFNDGQINVVMITNFFEPKREAILNTLEAIDLTCELQNKVRLILVGARGEFLEEMKEKAMAINKKHKKEVIFFAGYLKNAFLALKEADVVLGVGRSLFEGMAYGKPSLVVGEFGFAGMVNPKNIREIEYFNFSGRNNSEHIAPQRLSEVIVKVICEPQSFVKEIEFGKKYVWEEIAARNGIDKILQEYKVVRDHFSDRKRLRKTINLLKVLFPMLLDNYYNATKKMVKYLIK